MKPLFRSRIAMLLFYIFNGASSTPCGTLYFGVGIKALRLTELIFFVLDRRSQTKKSRYHCRSYQP
jgi:hypothetical protein